jgi:DNA-binding transcriptional MocR family regulator
MTIWLPDIADHPGPRYRAIADVLAADISAGALLPGARLPTHRDLAFRLGVTIGTVSRAYAEAERRGLVAGEVGRGTYVRAASRVADRSLAWHEAGTADFIDFAFNIPRVGDEAAALAATVTQLAAAPDFAAFVGYRAPAGHPTDRAAGAAWIARSLLPAAPERVVLTLGGQHGIALILSVLTRPGDTIAVECLTYPGLKALANLFDLRLVGLAMDDEGLVPDAFDAACRTGQVKALYTMPTLHNPLAIVMPEARRRAIAAVAERHGVPVLEDDALGFLVAEPVPPISAFARDQGFYIASTSKSLTPGLRVGYIHAPAAWVDRLAAAMRATSYMVAPLMAAAATSWIEQGTADRLVAGKRAMASARGRLARALLQDAAVRMHPDGTHLLLTPAEAWRGEDFVAAARRRGVGLAPVSAFAVGRASDSVAASNAIRLCYGTPPREAEVERGLRIVAELLYGEPTADLSVV